VHQELQLLKVALLGSNGFVGTRAVEMFFLGSQVEIRPIARNFAGLARSARFDIDSRVADAFDEEALANAFKGCDVLIHAAGGKPSMIVKTPGPIYRAAERAGIRRIVYVSTASVHGQDIPQGTTEDSELHLGHVMAYNNAKVRAERAFTALRDKGSVELVMLRPSIVFGPRSFWIQRFADSLLDHSAYVVDGGLGICNTIYVDNLVRAIELTLTAPNVDRQVFFVGEDELVTWADFYAPIADALGFDKSAIRSLPAPKMTLSLRERVSANADVKRLAQQLPRPVKERIKGLAYGKSPDPGSPWAPPSEAKVVASREMAMLHRNSVKLPSDRARRLLGYKPMPFIEGMHRSIGWLKFCGYPVVREASTG